MSAQPTTGADPAVPHVLLVEDDEAHAELIRRSFKRQGKLFEFHVLPSLAAAREHVRDCTPSVVISDLHLPDGRGYEILESDDGEPKYPLIIMTSQGNETEAVEAMKSGALDYVVKSNLTFEEMPHTVETSLRAWEHMVERKRAEASLRDLNQFRETIIDNASVWLEVLDTDGNVLVWNKAAEKISGYSREEVEGHAAINEWLYPDPGYRGEITSRLHGVVQENESLVDFTTSIRRKDDEIRVISWNAHRLNDENRQAAGCIAVGIDITEREHTEAALWQSEMRLSQIIQGSVIPTFVVDRRRVVTNWNRACEQLTGLSSSEMVGTQNHWSAFFDKPQPLLADMVAQGASTEEVVAACGANARPLAGISDAFEMEAFFPQLGKSGKWLFITASPLRSVDGSISGAIETMQDITRRIQREEERRELQSQIQRAQTVKSLGVMAGGIAHDFNNLLMGVLGNADILLEHTASSSPLRKRVESIRDGAERAERLARQMLTYSGRGRFAIQSLDLSQLVQSVEDVIRLGVPKRVQLTLELGGEGGALRGDATQLRHVIMGFVTNAVDAIGDEEGSITLRTGRRHCDDAFLRGTYYTGEALPEGDYQFMEVSDTGNGIAPEELPRVFEPFFTTKEMGRGLGLATALGIVRGHKGALKVESEPGKGATFTALFPAVQPQAEPPSEPTGADGSWQGSGTVLVVDDEDMVREVVVHMLERMGFTVLSVASGGEAIACVKEHIDVVRLVLLDMKMPGMDGVQTYEELRRIKSDLPVVLSTGYDETDTDTLIVDQNVAAFIHKPYRAQQLSELMQRVLDGVDQS